MYKILSSSGHEYYVEAVTATEAIARFAVLSEDIEAVYHVGKATDSDKVWEALKQ